jgi:hypothetical protein
VLQQKKNLQPTRGELERSQSDIRARMESFRGKQTLALDLDFILDTGAARMSEDAFRDVDCLARPPPAAARQGQWARSRSPRALLARRRSDQSRSTGTARPCPPPP